MAVCRNNNHNSATKMLPQKTALSFSILFAMFKLAPDILNQRDIFFSVNVIKNVAHKTSIKEHTRQWDIVVNKSTRNFWAAVVS